MKIAVLGTGMVGETIASKLVALGHEVRMGSRTADNAKAATWAEKAGEGASHGDFAAAAQFGDLVFVCTLGAATLDALRAAGADNLAGKIVVDLTNPLDFSRGAPRLFVIGDDSLGEQIQRAFPEARVVKALNTINCSVMVDPGRIPGEHATFIAGDDAAAKAEVTRLLTEGFGWRQVIDLGDISAARATEAYLLLWLRLWRVLGTADFNVAITRAPTAAR